MGGAYDLMPFYRYIWIVFFFGAFFYLLFPIVIYEIFIDLLDKQWAKYFLIFGLLPFSSFGFLHFYYVKLAIEVLVNLYLTYVFPR